MISDQQLWERALSKFIANFRFKRFLQKYFKSLSESRRVPGKRLPQMLRGMNCGRHPYVIGIPYLKWTVLCPVHCLSWTLGQFLDVTWTFLSAVPMVTPFPPSWLPFPSLLKFYPSVIPSNAVVSLKPSWLFYHQRKISVTISNGCHSTFAWFFVFSTFLV